VSAFLDSSGLRAGGFAALAVLSVALGVRESRDTRKSSRSLLPAYWWLTAMLLLVVAIAQATELADLVARTGREEARANGWYDARRSAQALAVAGVSGAWAVGVVVAIWRVPPRRRRYLPSALAVSALLAFIAVRAISLHQIDAVVYRSDLAGVRMVALVELFLLAVAGATMAVRLDPGRGDAGQRRIRSTAMSTRGTG